MYENCWNLKASSAMNSLWYLRSWRWLYEALGIDSKLSHAKMWVESFWAQDLRIQTNFWTSRKTFWFSLQQQKTFLIKDDTASNCLLATAHDSWWADFNSRVLISRQKNFKIELPDKSLSLQSRAHQCSQKLSRNRSFNRLYVIPLFTVEELWAFEARGLFL